MDTHIKNKFLTLISFIKFFEKNVPSSSCKIYGSFVRQAFEKIFISTPDESGYGNSQNHDIDISIFDSEEIYNNNMESFYNLIDILELMENIDDEHNLNSEFSDIKFGEYRVVKVYDITMNCHYEKRELKRKQELTGYLQYYSQIENLKKTIRQKFNGVPHFHVILYNKNENTYIIIDLLGYPIADNQYNIDDDIDVNTLYITRDGIKSKSDFLTTIESIIKRRGIIKIDMETMKNDLETKTLTFTEKSKIYNNIVNFLGLRTKILGNGYENLESETKIPKIYFETDDRCEITDLIPPYIGIYLECGHKMSVMALSGIVNIQKNEYSEYIGCPYCRQQLLPKLIEKNITMTNIPDTDDISMLYSLGIIQDPHKVELQQPIHKEIMSKENIDSILENMGYYNGDISNNTFNNIFNLNNSPDITNFNITYVDNVNYVDYVNNNLNNDTNNDNYTFYNSQYDYYLETHDYTIYEPLNNNNDDINNDDINNDDINNDDINNDDINNDDINNDDINNDDINNDDITPFSLKNGTVI
jgi:hypothetical protein